MIMAEDTADLVAVVVFLGDDADDDDVVVVVDVQLENQERADNRL